MERTSSDKIEKISSMDGIFNEKTAVELTKKIIDLSVQLGIQDHDGENQLILIVKHLFAEKEINENKISALVKRNSELETQIDRLEKELGICHTKHVFYPIVHSVFESTNGQEYSQ